MEKIQTGYVTVLNKSMGTSKMERKKKKEWRESQRNYQSKAGQLLKRKPKRQVSHLKISYNFNSRKLHILCAISDFNQTILVSG